MKLVIYSITNSSHDERFEFLEEDPLQVYLDYKAYCEGERKCAHGEYNVREMQMDHAPTGAKKSSSPSVKFST